MAVEHPLDLNKVDPAIWHTLVGGVSYGPYTLGQIRSFILDGRVTARTCLAEGDGGRFAPAAGFPQFAETFAERANTENSAPLSNYVIVSQIRSNDRSLTDALNGLGKFGEAMPGVFILRSPVKLARLRDQLRALSGATDQIIIVDATHDRLAWLGLGPEADIHMKAIWSKDAA